MGNSGLYSLLTYFNRNSEPLAIFVKRNRVKSQNSHL